MASLCQPWMNNMRSMILTEANGGSEPKMWSLCSRVDTIETTETTDDFSCHIDLHLDLNLDILR